MRKFSQKAVLIGSQNNGVIIDGVRLRYVLARPEKITVRIILYHPTAHTMLIVID